MHYLCLVYGQEAEKTERVSQTESRAMVEALAASGYDVAVFPLASPSEATTLRRTGDGLVLTDGPVTNGSARLQTVYVLGARDLNDAVRLAARLPEAGNAEIEIRPLNPLPNSAAVPSTAEISATDASTDARTTGGQPTPVPG